MSIMNCGPKKEQPAQTTPAPESVAVAESVPAQPAPEAPAATQGEAAQPLPKLWDFWATWCPPCKEQTPIVEELAREYTGIIEVKSIDVDQNKDLAEQFKVEAIPTLVFLDAQGNELSRRVGLYPKDSIVARLKSHGFVK